MKIFKFYDTCSILQKADYLFQDEENIVISSITLEELENIKTSANKGPDVKAAARKVTRTLEEHDGEYELEIYQQKYEKDIGQHHIFNSCACVLLGAFFLLRAGA